MPWSCSSCSMPSASRRRRISARSSSDTRTAVCGPGPPGSWIAIPVFSGDGGFNEALNGADGEVPLGFIPGGGTSVLPRTLGLPRDPVAAAAQLGEALATGRTRRISVGRANGRRFGFSCGVGLDAEAVRRVDELGRTHEGRRPGDLAFVRVVAGLVVERRGRFDQVLEVRGLGRGAFALVANTDPYTYAGRIPLHV